MPLYTVNTRVSFPYCIYNIPHKSHILEPKSNSRFLKVGKTYTGTIKSTTLANDKSYSVCHTPLSAHRTPVIVIVLTGGAQVEFDSKPAGHTGKTTIVSESNISVLRSG